VPFPFSDLSQAKLRPAIALADAGRDDWILCQVTSNPYGDSRAVRLTVSSFDSGSLRADSYARPGKLFTASHTSRWTAEQAHSADARDASRPGRRSWRARLMRSDQRQESDATRAEMA
jgi:mRNA interferase MazF